MFISISPFFDFISSFQTSNPSVRDSVNCILTCIRSKQNQKQKKKDLKKKERNPMQTHTHRHDTAIPIRHQPRVVRKTTPFNSIPMIILEYIMSFFAAVFPMNTTLLPHWARQRSTMQHNNRERKTPSWIRTGQCTAPLVISTRYWVSAVKLGLRWPPLAHHPPRVHKDWDIWQAAAIFFSFLFQGCVH